VVIRTCEHGNELSGSIKRGGPLLVSQEKFFSVELLYESGKLGLPI